MLSSNASHVSLSPAYAANGGRGREQCHAAAAGSEGRARYFRKDEKHQGPRYVFDRGL